MEIAEKFARDQRLMKRLCNGSSGTGAAKAGSTRPVQASTSGAPHTAPAPPVSAEPNALFKELSTKLAWSLGSTFGLDYSRRSDIRLWAEKRASALVEAYARLPNSKKAGL